MRGELLGGEKKLKNDETTLRSIKVGVAFLNQYHSGEITKQVVPFHPPSTPLGSRPDVFAYAVFFFVVLFFSNRSGSLTF